MTHFKDNIKACDAKLPKLNTVLKRFSVLRVLTFVCSIILLIALIRIKLFTVALITFPITLLLFGYILNQYDKIAALKKHTLFLKNINASEILRAACDLESFDTGDTFINQTHPYTSDLDIFGQHSMFQLVNRTTTESGRLRLSEWLTTPASISEISNRQKAIKELSSKLEWRQDFQATGLPFQNKKSEYSKLLAWVEQPVALFKNRHMYWAIAIVIPIVLLVTAYFFYVHLESKQRFIYLALIILVLLINYFILKKVSPHAEDIVETSTENLNTLQGYRALIAKIENESFKSQKLQALQATIFKGKYSASSEIKSICKLLEFSHQKPIKKVPIGGSYMYQLLNSFLLLDIYLIIETEKWKLKNKTFLKLWAEVISEFEVLNSFAGFYFANPTYTFPEVTETNNAINFKALGHPLIETNKRVCNDFQSEGHGNIVMITGSNMGGKSTFLRTVGLNLVLAFSGAPCCATSAKVSRLHVFTSMRTQDNLMKGTSSFYAELHRIENMLKLIARQPNVFFLLDEMFKGTNSKDRHRGGFSLINQLSMLKTSGIIATHDIELAKLSGHQKQVTNYSFNSTIKDDVMVFSYTLDPFICTDFNASELMKRSGITILSDIPKLPNS